MKLKPMSILAGVLVAVTLVATTPLAAFAQNSTPNSPQQSPQTQESPQTRPTRPRIVLSEEQQKKFQQIQASAIGQIEAVLTPQQKTQFAEGRETGRGLDAIQNLSDDQKGKIVGILQNLNEQIGNLLTPEQKRTIEQSQSNQR